MLSPRLVLLVALLCVGGLSACAGPRALVPVLPEVPAEQARCQVAASQSSPLVTEWPASEKANLEALLRQGAVAVEYSGCALRVLPRCRLGGGYVWQRTTPSADSFDITDEDTLYARLPLGAASLEGELKRSGSLAVYTLVAGLLRLEGPEAVPEVGECARATHLVEALSVGAFSLSRGGSASVGASAGVASIGQVGGSMGASERLVRSAGDPQVCGAGTDEAPHPNCASPLQVFLRPLHGRAAEEGPPGMVKVDFISTQAQGRWDVYIDDEVACSTPCSRWVAPSRPILLRAREGAPFVPSDRIHVPSLEAYAQAGALQVRAQPTSQGELVTGITFAGLGGMGLFFGGTFSLVGCQADSRRAELCQGGLITLGAGALVALGGTWLILDAAPRAKIVPASSSPSRSGPSVRVGPGFMMGRF